MVDSHSAATPDRPLERHEPTQHIGIQETARLVGAYIWAESRLFETLGGWLATIPEHPVKVRLGIHCSRHAWHADLWRARLPEIREKHPDHLIAPANEAIATFADAVAEPHAGGATIEKLVGVYRVFVPRLAGAYAAHRQAISEIADAPTVRVLTLVLADVVEQWREGETLVESLLQTPEDADRAAAHLARLERLIVAAGGLTG